MSRKEKRACSKASASFVQDSGHRESDNDDDSCSTAGDTRNQPKQKRVAGNPRDILCGRGLHIVNHHGNLQLHLLINKHRLTYQQSGRQQKSRITHAIVKEIKRTGARFLERVVVSGEDDKWVEVDDKKAYSKVSHALRLQRHNETNKPQMGSQDAPSRIATPGTSGHLVSTQVQFPHQQSSFPGGPQMFGRSTVPQNPLAQPNWQNSFSLPASGPTPYDRILQDHFQRQMMQSILSSLRHPSPAMARSDSGVVASTRQGNTAAEAPETTSSQSGFTNNDHHNTEHNPSQEE
eukprot:scaffold14697_cov124-Cylindrotheca_fusiformis.AAC.8